MSTSLRSLLVVACMLFGASAFAQQGYTFEIQSPARSVVKTDDGHIDITFKLVGIEDAAAAETFTTKMSDLSVIENITLDANTGEGLIHAHRMHLPTLLKYLSVAGVTHVTTEGSTYSVAEYTEMWNAERAKK